MLFVSDHPIMLLRCSFRSSISDSDEIFKDIVNNKANNGVLYTSFINK